VRALSRADGGAQSGIAAAQTVGRHTNNKISSGPPPIVFITDYGDIPCSVRAMKAGAVDFLAKLFSQQELLAAINSTLE
jgi:FixJ family two-component response regulator